MQNDMVRYAGLGLILLGMMLRLMIIRSLGRYFTVDVAIRKDHRIKKTGFYTHIRHPSYLASLVSFTGFGLSMNNWITLLIVTIPVLIAFIIRMDLEEKVLISHFGEEYILYKKSTKKLIPFIY
jgi:protein-S-isoprenylcysteine O-methyltransferase Ste14